ncbi:MAG: hypothetical protein U5K30_06750 [Acidimicrobiales bacterium]|nr:hypothetical protein [Acidimicrobiales bacterium]
MPTRTMRVLGVVFAAVLLVAACGDDDTTAETGGSATDDGTTERTDDESETNASDAPVQEAETSLGPTLVDAEGLTLYGFTPDEGGTPTCTDACAGTWPPLFVDSAELPEGLDPALYSVVEHPSGEFQLAAGGWPLYYYAADASAGDVNGQGVGGNWFAVAPDGTLIEGSGADGGSSGNDEAEADDLEY